jgi:hypothetical protein
LNIKIEEMLIDYSRGRLDEMKEFAKENGLSEQLDEVLKNLTKWEDWYYKREMLEIPITLVFSDHAPLSLYFERTVDSKFIGNGGVIFHGPHDGYGNGGAPTFSVSLSSEKKVGWSIHT